MRGAINLKSRHGLMLALTAAAFLALLVLLPSILEVFPYPIGQAAGLFATGAQYTVYLTVISGVAGILLGLMAGLGKLSHNPIVRGVCEFYVWIFRGTPLLTQLLFFYLALPTLFPGLGITEFWTAVLALSLNVGAYNTEAFRAAVQAIPTAQTRAGLALGMKPGQVFFSVVFPQAFKIALPTLANNKVALLKDSSLAYAIGVVELNMIAQRVQAETFQPVPVFITVAAIYLSLTTIFSQFANVLERKYTPSVRH